jgi:hypothetical protein
VRHSTPLLYPFAATTYNRPKPKDNSGVGKLQKVDWIWELLAGRDRRLQSAATPIASKLMADGSGTGVTSAKVVPILISPREESIPVTSGVLTGPKLLTPR